MSSLAAAGVTCCFAIYPHPAGRINMYAEGMLPALCRLIGSGADTGVAASAGPGHPLSAGRQRRPQASPLVLEERRVHDRPPSP
jgi:hypothetical protein